MRFARGDSKSPYRGRGGRSGVLMPLVILDTDAERTLSVMTDASMAIPPSCSKPGDHTGDRAVVDTGRTDSLILRSCL